jgi:hypothetical protein
LNRPIHAKKGLLEIAEEEFIKGFYFQMGVRSYEEYANTPGMSDIKKLLLMRSMFKNAEDNKL